MPLPMKTLREASLELGMPEAEIRTLVDLRKVRAILKRGVLYFAPDELAKIKRQRKTLPESAVKSAAAATAAQPAPPAAATKKAPPPRRTVPRRPPPPQP
ncbi:MAG: hypothetical protein ACKV0T_17825 [Planctomycetales bacterium]